MPLVAVVAPEAPAQADSRCILSTTPLTLVVVYLSSADGCLVVAASIGVRTSCVLHRGTRLMRASSCVQRVLGCRQYHVLRLLFAGLAALHRVGDAVVGV